MFRVRFRFKYKPIVIGVETWLLIVRVGKGG